MKTRDDINRELDKALEPNPLIRYIKNNLTTPLGEQLVAMTHQEVRDKIERKIQEDMTYKEKQRIVKSYCGKSPDISDAHFIAGVGYVTSPYSLRQNLIDMYTNDFIPHSPDIDTIEYTDVLIDRLDNLFAEYHALFGPERELKIKRQTLIEIINLVSDDEKEPYLIELYALDGKDYLAEKADKEMRAEIEADRRKQEEAAEKARNLAEIEKRKEYLRSRGLPEEYAYTVHGPRTHRVTEGTIQNDTSYHTLRRDYGRLI